ncbi:MAG: chromate resistance protein [Burkholderiaceae bacterium]
MTDWLVLSATLPTHPSALRVRVWRALKATGAGTLREGVYVLPAHAPSAEALWALERSITEAGAEAHLLLLKARDAAQEAAFRALFDRGEAYAELRQAVKGARAQLRRAGEAELRRGLRGLEQRLAQVAAGDFFPGAERDKAQAAVAALRRDVEQRLSPGEPASTAAAGLEPLDKEDFQGRTWATRKRPWVDRLATAWLLQRFVDRSPRFAWLASPADCPKRALGYDFDGARFTHRQLADGRELVSFEVVAHSFGLAGDPALQRLGALVHCIDIGGAPVDEAPGVELLVRGLQARHAKDDALLAAALPLFDSLHAGFAALTAPHAPP